MLERKSKKQRTIDELLAGKREVLEAAQVDWPVSCLECFRAVGATSDIGSSVGEFYRHCKGVGPNGEKDKHVKECILLKQEPPSGRLINDVDFER